MFEGSTLGAARLPQHRERVDEGRVLLPAGKVVNRLSPERKNSVRDSVIINNIGL